MAGSCRFTNPISFCRNKKEKPDDVMARRFVSIWFRHLKTDWFTLRQPLLKSVPFVLRTSSHGRMIISAVNAAAAMKGISTGMALADARAFIPGLEVLDDKPDLVEKLLERLAEWCIRFTPVVAVDLPDGLMMDVTGCPHLWGGDARYLHDIVHKLNARGYDVRAAMADTMGVAWGVARFGKEPLIVEPGRHIEALMPLPPEALRLEEENVERLYKLGLRQLHQLIKMPRAALRRRFGQVFIQQLDKASGYEPVSRSLYGSYWKHCVPVSGKSKKDFAQQSSKAIASMVKLSRLTLALPALRIMFIIFLNCLNISCLRSSPRWASSYSFSKRRRWKITFPYRKKCGKDPVDWKTRGSPN
jgi:nucleotidyltransferase/DNA polymerase involved in DNA repair